MPRAGTAQRTLSENFAFFEGIGEGSLGSGLRCGDQAAHLNKAAQRFAFLKDAR
jgi:hypothetical protein